MGTLGILVSLLLILSELHQAHGQSTLQRGVGSNNNDRNNDRYNGRQSCRNGERSVGYCSWSGRCSIPTARCRNQMCCISGVTPTRGVCSAFNQRELGPCINGGCQTGATCISGRCCTANGSGNGSAQCPTGATIVGPCVSNSCPPNANCISNSICCTVVG